MSFHRIIVVCAFELGADFTAQELGPACHVQLSSCQDLLDQPGEASYGGEIEADGGGGGEYGADYGACAV